MYLLYIDESENSDKGTAVPSVFGLAGILATDRYIPDFVDEVLDLRQRFGVPTGTEIHGYEIFNNHAWGGLDDGQRRDFCRELARIIIKPYRLTSGFFAFKKSAFTGNDYITCLSAMVDDAANFVAMHGGMTNKQMMVIFDEMDRLERSINAVIVEKQKEVLAATKKKHGKICRLIDHGFPGKSHLSAMLQVADFTGYVLRLNKSIQRTDTIFQRAKDPRFIAFVDELVASLEKKVKTVKC